MTHKFSFAKEYRAKTIFEIINYTVLFLCCLVTLIPIWKVIVDSLSTGGARGLQLLPVNPSLDAYIMVMNTPGLTRPFWISVYVTVVGTFLGLLISTTAAYVLIQYKMPGRKLFSWLILFTMIFNGGMVPTFLVMRDLGLLNSLWAIILPSALNVYNLVLMRNFFEGIPESLYESAELDGCSPMMTFWKIVLPLSKPALASIGLFFAVAFWSEYTSFALYITEASLFNFQIRLRSLILDDANLTAATTVGISAKAIQNAAIIIALAPFVVIYPLCQRFFVTGVTMGAVKE